MKTEMVPKYTCEYCGRVFYNKDLAIACEEECTKSCHDMSWYQKHKPKFAVGDLLFDKSLDVTVICDAIIQGPPNKLPCWEYRCKRDAYDSPIRCISEDDLTLVMTGAEHKEILRALNEYKKGIRGVTMYNYEDDGKTAVIVRDPKDMSLLTIYMSLPITLGDLRAFSAKYSIRPYTN